MDDYQIETLLSHYAEEREKYSGAVNMPIFQNSLFVFPDWDSISKAFEDPVNSCIYTRGKNPSVHVTEKKIARLAFGEKAKLFSSGMGAISSAILHFIKSGDHVITIKNIYRPSNIFLNTYLKNKMNIDVSFVSGADPEEFKREIRANTKLIYLESPSSSLFLLQDIKKIAEIAKEKNIKTIIDNTWATPIFQKPLSMGIDIEVHSCSKYIGGHSDVVAGVVIGKTKDIDQIFLNEHALFGSRISAFESWLIMRSLRTLPIRMMKHQENAMKVAEFLEGHPRIKVVNYPGLKSYPQYDLAKEQMSGYSGLLSFIIDINNIALVKKFVNSLKLFKIGISWGGYESLVFAPVIALKEFTEEKLMSMGIDKAMVRISVGLENHIDLINDLDNALMKI